MQVDNIFLTKSDAQTQEIAKNLAKEILKNGLQKKAVVLALQGDLGVGKTTFTQGFAKGLTVTEKILSPTFVVMKRFEIKNNKFKHFYHLDCYRLKDEKDIEQLGFREILENPENIILIEWPEKIKKSLPKKYSLIEFKHLEEGKREIKYMVR